MSISILIVDDHKIMREGLRSLLEDHADFRVAGEAGDGQQALELCRELCPDLVLMDITLPEINGLIATREIMYLPHPPRVMMLSMNSDSRFVASAFDVGACAYLLKEDAFEEIARAIHLVMEGKQYISPSVARNVVDKLKNTSTELMLESENRLSSKELEVLQYLAEGKSTKEIAFQLGVSSKTVDSHRQKIMQKLDVHSIAELTKYAVRQGLTPL